MLLHHLRCPKRSYTQPRDSKGGLPVNSGVLVDLIPHLSLLNGFYFTSDATVPVIM